MRKFYILGAALFAVLAFSAVAAGSASAATPMVWLVGGQQPTTPAPVDSEGTLLLENMNTAQALLCLGDSTGTVGPGAADLTETVTVLSCENEKNCTTPKAVAEHLPWSTLLLELVLATESILDEISQDGNGTPGYLVECGGVQALCEGNTEPIIENLLAEVPRDVDALFTAATGTTKCPLNTTGIIEGEILILSTESLDVEVS